AIGGEGEEEGEEVREEPEVPAGEEVGGVPAEELRVPARSRHTGMEPGGGAEPGRRRSLRARAARGGARALGGRPFRSRGPGPGAALQVDRPEGRLAVEPLPLAAIRGPVAPGRALHPAREGGDGQATRQQRGYEAPPEGARRTEGG